MLFVDLPNIGRALGAIDDVQTKRLEAPAADGGAVQVLRYGLGTPESPALVVVAYLPPYLDTVAASLPLDQMWQLVVESGDGEAPARDGERFPSIEEILEAVRCVVPVGAILNMQMHNEAPEDLTPGPQCLWLSQVGAAANSPAAAGLIMVPGGTPAAPA